MVTKGVCGIFLVYDVTNKSSFEDTMLWLQGMKIYIGNSRVAIVLVGTKCDRKYDREVTEEEGRKLAKEKNLFFFETSAKSSERVIETFETPLDKILDKIFLTWSPRRGWELDKILRDKEMKKLSDKKPEKQNCILF